MRIILLLIQFFISTLYCLGQSTDNSVIIDTAINFIKPDKFYISGIIDSRINKTINNFYLGSFENKNISTIALSLPEIIKGIVDKRLVADSGLAPVVIDIKQFSILSKDSSGWSRDQLKIDMRFQSVLSGQHVEFAFYSYTQNLYKYMANQKYYSALLQRELPEIIIQLNRVINNSYNNFPFHGIKIINRITNPDLNMPDTIFYKLSKKLSWKDFKGIPDIFSDASATTASSFLYNSTSEIKEGYKIVSVNTKCFFLKNNSWVKRNIVSGYVLDHEQLHFDITYLWSLQFSKAIRKLIPDTENWQVQLDSLYQVLFSKMSSMQEDYDRESDNGRNGKKQRFWKKKISGLITESPL